MFSLVEGIYDSYLAPTQLNLLVVGASGVGKTSLLERLKVTHMPKRPSSRSALPSVPKEPTTALQDAFVQGGALGSASGEAAAGEVPPRSWNATGNEAQAAATTPAAPSLPPPQIVVTQKRRFPMICPAPERYRRSTQDQEEDFVMDEEEEQLLSQVDESNANTTDDDNMEEPQYVSSSENEGGVTTMPLEAPLSPIAPIRVRCHSKDFNMTELDLVSDGAPIVPALPARAPQNRNSSMESISLEEPSEEPVTPKEQGPVVPNTNSNSSRLVQAAFEEYNLKSKAKMLPMSKIRPTIGTNLGKIDMYGAKCSLFDVGGRMQALWERYYEDCDAVIFCWKLGEDPEQPPKAEGDKNEGEDLAVDFSKQMEILNQVRRSIPDDIPFLVFGHVFGNVHLELVDTMYSTDYLLPHYHNPMTGMCCGSAKTGAGVQSSMEWLIPLAKRQKLERLAARKKLDEKL